MSAQVLHVSTSRGDDELGDGSLEAPFLTVEHADTVRDPEDVICHDGFLANSFFSRACEAEPLDYPDVPKRRSGGVVVLAAVMCGLVIGASTPTAWWSLIVGAVIAVVFVWLDWKDTQR